MERKDIKEKELILKNGKGKTVCFRLRQYCPGDEAGMVACIRDEYGESYFKRDFYDLIWLRKKAQTGHMIFLVAETQNDGIAGMLVLKEFAPGESMCEIASQIFRKKYRGYGLAMPFFEYGMEILLSLNFSAAYCLPVLFHDVTQRLLYRLGMRATGFVMNVFDMDEITHSYPNGRNRKHSQGIQIRAADRRDAGTVYVPWEHRDFCRKIYASLGVRYHIAKEGESSQNGNNVNGRMPEASEVEYRQDSVQSSLEIRIQRVGSDLSQQMAALLRRFPLRSKQTANVFLNISDCHALWAYRTLEKSGFFFTGLKPLCSEREYMVLHHPGEVEMYFEDYRLSEEFKILLENMSVKLNKEVSDDI